MIGAMEIMMIAIIFGIIYGRDAIDKTWKKRPDENLTESFAADVKEFYDKDPKRFVKVVGIVIFTIVAFVVMTYWAFTHTDLLKILGIDD